MPLPPSLSLKTLHGRYSALPTGAAPTGTVDFVAPAVLRVATDDTIVLPTIYTATVTAGEFTLSLPASDDPAISPNGWTYEVVERLAGHPIRRYRIAIPHATSGTLELSDLTPATTVIPAASYATTAQLVALDARVDELEAHPGGGVTDHGALTGLADDDHTQYYDAARLATALSPYATTAAVTTGLTSKADTGHTHAETDVTNLVADLSGKAPTVHSHAQADVTGLSAALAAKAPTAHAHLQADVTGLDSALAGKAAATHTHSVSDVTGLSAALSAAATKPVIRSAYITGGDVNPLPDTGGAWSRPGAANGLPASFTLTIPAAVGDWVEIGLHGMKTDHTTVFFDVGVLVGTTVVRYLATGTNTAAFEGDPGWYSPPYRTITAARGFVVQAGHLDGTDVRFILANKTAGSGVLYASTTYPFYWAARNLGPVS